MNKRIIILEGGNRAGKRTVKQQAKDTLEELGQLRTLRGSSTSHAAAIILAVDEMLQMRTPPAVPTHSLLYQMWVEYTQKRLKG